MDRYAYCTHTLRAEAAPSVSFSKAAMGVKKSRGLASPLAPMAPRQGSSKWPLKISITYPRHALERGEEEKERKVVDMLGVGVGEGLRYL